MRSRLLWLLAGPALWLGLTPAPGLAQKSAGSVEDKETIAKNAEAFVDAFHKGDAKALAAFWTPDGDYIDQTGKSLKGRKAIAKAFQGLFAENKGLKLRIDSLALRFVSPNVAIEDGITSVIPPDGSPPSRARYTAVHVREDGQWHLSSVRDAPYAAPSNYGHLRALEWALGDWASENDKGGTERLSFAWSDNQNFILGSFATTHKDVAVAAATVWTGWDPVTKHIRSWIFDANGGFGEGTWARDGKRWALKTTSVHQDGKRAAATFVLTRVDADTVTLQGTDRSLDGKPLPDSMAVTLKRVK